MKLAPYFHKCDPLPWLVQQGAGNAVEFLDDIQILISNLIFSVTRLKFSATNCYSLLKVLASIYFYIKMEINDTKNE